MNNYHPKIFRFLILSLLFIFFIYGQSLAQQTMFGNEEQKQPELPEINLKKKELHDLVDVYEKMVDLEAQYNLKIMQIVQKHGMKLGRYETLSAAERLNTQIETEPGEKQQYREIKTEISREKRKTRRKMEELLLNHQFSRRRYGLFLQKLKRDTAFRKKVENIRGTD
jgi:hypothetical protein